MRAMKDLYINAMKHVKVTLILSRKVTIVFIQEIIFNLCVKQVHFEFYKKKNIKTSLNLKKK